MKKKLIAIVMACIMIFTLVGCYKDYNEVRTEDIETNFSGGYFTVIKYWNDGSGRYRIVYANDTKVIYFIERSSYSYGITPLYNADGTLQVYNEG